MSFYHYLWCQEHKQYVHMGKCGRTNYENPEVSKKFIEDHDGCLLRSVGEYNDKYYQDCMDDVEVVE